MTISAKMILDSVSPAGIRLSTVELRYPRLAHAEVMTHRVFTRNASSSRAIPVKRQLSVSVGEDIVIPLRWGLDIKGMQAGDDMSPEAAAECEAIWRDMAEYTRRGVERLNELKLHKQWANRPTEWFSHINVLVSSTNYANFYNLRRHKDAQPEIQALADAMHDCQGDSVPTLLRPGEWHMPYVTNEDEDNVQAYLQNMHGTTTVPLWEIRDLLLKVSVARCARVSYKTHDGRDTTIQEDMELADRLLGSVPLHASPAEHQATPDVFKVTCNNYGYETGHWVDAEYHGNFHGWKQHRKLLDDESVAEPAYDMIDGHMSA